MTDNGNGMTLAEFERGFLTIASRLKETAERRSPVFGRRYTGEKGVGRLAAHKLATQISVRSIPRKPSGRGRRGVTASINWEELETFRTLEEASSAILLETFSADAGARPGTEIRLSDLRRPWGQAERDNFLAEASSFEPPSILRGSLPSRLAPSRLLFNAPKVRDQSQDDSGFSVVFEGDFEAQGELWDELMETIEWIVEISASRDMIRYVVAPSRREKDRHPAARPETYSVPHPDPKNGPFFDVRVMFRARGSTRSQLRNFSRQVSGIRVYMEGFRVLPYGEVGNDWLWLDRDVTQRLRTLRLLDRYDELRREEDEDSDWALTIYPNDAYVGAVYLTTAGAPTLQTLVNREGFVPNSAYSLVQDHVRIGIDLIVRARSAAHAEERAARRTKRREGGSEEEVSPSVIRRDELRQALDRTQVLGQEVKSAISSGSTTKAKGAIKKLEHELEALSGLVAEFITEQGLLPVLASVGIQMAQFAHEINGLVGLVQAIDSALGRIRDDVSGPGSRKIRTEIAEAHQSVTDLRRRLERQASYLVDVVTPDSRRRRSRQKLAERFDAAARLVEVPSVNAACVCRTKSRLT